MDRRIFLRLTGTVCLAGAIPPALMAMQTSASISLTTNVSKVNIASTDYPATELWSFNGQVPGEPLRVHRWEVLDVVSVSPKLEVPTSDYRHGIGRSDAMDRVSGLTQEALFLGASFRYKFAPPDAGTYWVHPHTNAFDQVTRGLYGMLIVEDDIPPTVHRILIWMVDDWRLRADASIQEDFGAGHDRSHSGRIGNVHTLARAAL